MYKSKDDGSSTIKLIDIQEDATSHSRISDINVLGEWIYYECDVHTPGDDYFTYKCKVKTNGSENSIIDPKYR